MYGDERGWIGKQEEGTACFGARRTEQLIETFVLVRLA
jgi:hypothetical protein